MFQGFSPETVDFLWGIRMNNERGWFEAHKKEYNDYLYGPMKELGAAVFQRFREFPELELKVSRIYRDARMHPPTPYKESLWFCIRRAEAYWAQNPTLFFEIRPEGATYGFTLWEPKTDTMQAFRRELGLKPGEFSELVEAAQAQSGLKLTAESYKRLRPSENPEPYYQWRRHLEAVREELPGPELFTPNLSDRVADALYPWVPLCRYFDRLV